MNLSFLYREQGILSSTDAAKEAPKPTPYIADGPKISNNSNYQIETKPTQAETAVSAKIGVFHAIAITHAHADEGMRPFN